MDRLKIAKVTWQDASHYRGEETVGWYKDNASSIEFVTVGHLIRYGKELVIAHEINEEARARDVTVIPCKMVKRIDYLGVRNEKK